MVRITVRERGTRAAIKRMGSKSRYLARGMRRRLQETGERVGVPAIQDAMEEAGIRKRTEGGLFDQVAVVDSSPTSVTLGFSSPKYEGRADTLDKGRVLPAIPFRVGVTIPLEKGAVEGVVFRRSVGPRSIRAFGWSRRAVDLLRSRLPSRFEAFLQQDIGERGGV